MSFATLSTADYSGELLLHAQDTSRQDIVRHKTAIQLRIYNRYQLAHTEWGACAEKEMVSEKGQIVLAFVEFTVHIVKTLAIADIIQRITQINEILKL